MRRSIGTTTAAVAALALAVTACGGGDGGDGGGGAAADGELSGTITYWDTSNETEAAVFKAIAEEFATQHPGVTVDYVNIGFDDAQNRFKNAAAANEAPDVMRTEVAWVADFASLGYLWPLDDTTALENQEDFLPQAWASTQYEGTTYAVPQVIDTLALFYNERLLADAGVEVPTTLEEVKASTGAFEGAGAVPMYMRGDDPYWFLPFLYGEGGDMVDAEGKKVTIDDEAGIAAFTQMKDMVDSGAAITDTSDGWENMMGSFTRGEVAMMINGPWAINDAVAGLGDDLGVAPVPGGSAGQAAPQGGWNYAIYAGTPEEESPAAFEFVKYMSSAATQQRITEELSLLPTRTSVYDVESVRNNEMVQFFKPAVDVAHERPWIPQAQSLFDPIKENVQGLLIGSASPEEAAKSTGDAYRDILDDWLD
ncbi:MULTISPECIES: extracellular solute-binding protein [Streptomyces]|jgi:arabinogalactan oligomer/maltooligosaccharide transport system substrate-binding protein|uniref:extracellular solute-binding protein n=1 Tax=Streptomyces TaxID=1883 RepID=UPI001907118B|nr:MULTISPECIES: extracellular solute-binding protein [unclassified Streptomyces]MCU4745185.1 extracellular solute-binding protein [Streptomyces sp. G-5]QQN79866.1 extracellular solute-binding protein [Streptomyces sp. XC 2026]